MTQRITLTFATFARDLGAHDHLTRDVSIVWYNQYRKADAATRTALREEFILNFLIGYFNKPSRAGAAEARRALVLAEKKAAKVMATSRTERSADDQRTYDAARAKFKYHVVRDAGENSPQGSAETDPVEQLVAKFNKLTAVQRRRFLKAVAQ